MSLSSATASLLQSTLANAIGEPGLELTAIYPVGGGSINATYRIITKDNGQWFSKVATEKKVAKGFLSRSTHDVGELQPEGPHSQPGSHPVINEDCPFPDFFLRKKEGLEYLQQQNVIRIPAVVALEASGGTQILILEWIDQQPPTGDFWSIFGEQLARLHRVSAASYGLEVDNYIGSLPQQNTQLPVKTDQSPTLPPFAIWTDFFIQRRLEPLIQLAFGKGLLPASALDQFQRLYTALPDIFPEEAPSLLHGDLWSGNFLCDEHNQPVLIDPAVYFGHRSMDLAMTTLFGGFEPAFYEAYHHHFPLPSNYRQQWEIANLYPLLVHLNLFGKSYQGNILHTIQRF